MLLEEDGGAAVSSLCSSLDGRPVGLLAESLSAGSRTSLCKSRLNPLISYLIKNDQLRCLSPLLMNFLERKKRYR